MSDHPSWCNVAECTIDAEGPSFLRAHRSLPVVVKSGRASLSARLEQLVDGLPVVVVNAGVTGISGSAPVPPSVAFEFGRQLAWLANRANEDRRTARAG